MKLIKMNEECLKIHLTEYFSLYPYVYHDVTDNDGRVVIWTTRDEIKGRVGELFHIEGMGDTVFILEEVSKPMKLMQICSKYYSEEGFTCPGDMKKMLKKFYPNSKEFYAHKFVECFDEGD